MDLSLPEIDGWESTKVLKANPTIQPILVIALTTHIMDGDRANAIEAGCDDYDTNPSNSNAFYPESKPFSPNYDTAASQNPIPTYVYVQVSRHSCGA